MNAGKLLARVVVGGLFVAHGTQKLFGWFDGPGIEGASKMMHSIGLRPGRRNALAASATELIGGAMLVAGALTPLAAAGLIATMITAIRTVHLKNGLWNSKGGYEFNLAMIAAILAIIEGGPGELSVDSALGLDDTGPGWALASLAAGALGSTIAIEVARRQPEEQAAAPEQQPAESAPKPAAVSA